MLGVHRAHPGVQRGLQLGAQAAEIPLEFGLLGQELTLELLAAGLDAAFGTAHRFLQHLYADFQFGFLGLIVLFQSGEAGLVLGLYFRAERIVFGLRLAQARGVLGLDVEQALVPALDDALLLPVELLELRLVLLLEGGAELVEAALLAQQLLQVELTLPKEGHGGFQLGIKAFFFVESFGTAAEGLLQLAHAGLELLAVPLGKAEVLLELGALFFDAVEALQRPAQRHPRRVYAGNVVDQLFELVIFVGHSSPR